MPPRSSQHERPHESTRAAEDRRGHVQEDQPSLPPGCHAAEEEAPAGPRNLHQALGDELGCLFPWPFARAHGIIDATRGSVGENEPELCRKIIDPVIIPHPPQLKFDPSTGLSAIRCFSSSDSALLFSFPCLSYALSHGSTSIAVLTRIAARLVWRGSWRTGGLANDTLVKVPVHERGGEKLLVNRSQIISCVLPNRIVWGYF